MEQQAFYGRLDEVADGTLSGWAMYRQQPMNPLSVRIDGVEVARIMADGVREDVAKHYGLSDTRYGFRYRIPPALRLGSVGDVRLEVCSAVTGQPLIGSPRRIRLGPGGIPLSLAKPPAVSEWRCPVEVPSRPVAQSMRIALVTLNLNGGYLLGELLASFQRHNTHANYEWIIVDHGSHDDSVAVCEAWKDRLNLRVLQRGGNYSFSASNNRAVQHTEADYVVFLNNDVIFHGDIMARLAAHLADETVGMVGVRLQQRYVGQKDSGADHHLGIAFTTDRDDRFALPMELPINDYTASVAKGVWEVPAVTAALAMMRRADFLAIGGFHEDYFYGFEDVDLCLTLRDRLGKRILCDNRVDVDHYCSISRQKHSAEEKRRVALNKAVLEQRTGLHLMDALRREQLTNQPLLRMTPVRVAFAVTEVAEATAAGDYYTALELAEMLHASCGWECFFLERSQWYAGGAFDVLIAMVEGFDPSRLQRIANDTVLIAWVRNWFERWIAHEYLERFDQVWISSEQARRRFAAVTSIPVKLLRIATNPERFQMAQPDSALRSDYCFTGSFFGAPRDIAEQLDPEAIGHDFALFGHGWHAVEHLKPWACGPLPYADMPRVYASTRLVIDDANHTCKAWGAANSRVFDALAAGALVITNSASVSEDVFGGRLPVYRDRDELTRLVRYYLENEEQRRELVRQLRTEVLQRHTYPYRAREVRQFLHQAFLAERVLVEAGSQPELAMAVVGVLRAQGFRVSRRRDDRLGRHRELGAEVLIHCMASESERPSRQPAAGKVNVLVAPTPIPQARWQDFDMAVVPIPFAESLPTSCYTVLLPSSEPVTVGMASDALGQASAVIRHCLRIRRKIAVAERGTELPVEQQAACAAKSIALRFFPDYTATNPYQQLLYRGLDRQLDLAPGDIDAALKLVAGQHFDSVIFHLHWTSVIPGATDRRAEAQARIERFLDQMDRFIAQGGRLFWTIHNAVSHEAPFPELEARLCQALAERAEVIHVHSPRVPALVADWYGLPEHKVWVGHHGSYIGWYDADPGDIEHIDRAVARRWLGVPNDAKVLLFLGQIRAYKGLSRLIDAFKHVRAEQPDAWLVIAGGAHGFDLAELQQQLRGVDHVITRFERIPDDRLRHYLHAADFMVVPYTRVLTSGSVVLASSFGLPTIAPDLGLIGETVRDGDTGLLYQPEEPASLLATLQRAMSLEPSARMAMARAAYHDARNNDWRETRRALHRHAVCGRLAQRERFMTEQDSHECYVSRPQRLTVQARAAIVVLHYAHLDDTLRCLESIKAQQIQDFDLYVISNDETPEAFVELVVSHPDAIIIQAPRNLGYAGGNNLALAEIRQKRHYDYFWILNPDTVVPRNLLGDLLDRADRYPQVGVFGVAITFGDRPDTVWFAGGDIRWENGLETSHRYLGKPVSELPTEPMEVDYVTGASLFGRTEILDKVGLIPEEYFLYFEETDWCMQMRSAGYQLLVFPDLRMQHYKRSESGGAPTMDYLKYYCNNALRFTEKYNPEKYEDTLGILYGKSKLWIQQIKNLNKEYTEKVEKFFEIFFTKKVAYYSKSR